MADMKAKIVTDATGSSLPCPGPFGSGRTGFQAGAVRPRGSGDPRIRPKLPHRRLQHRTRPQTSQGAKGRQRNGL